jgi:hypothetical protein
MGISVASFGIWSRSATYVIAVSVSEVGEHRTGTMRPEEQPDQQCPVLTGNLGATAGGRSALAVGASLSACRPSLIRTVPRPQVSDGAGRLPR